MKKIMCGFIAGAVLATGIGSFASGMWKNIDVLENDITVMVDGEKVSEDNFVYNDRTYLPLRAVADAVGKPVDYDEATNTAYIGSGAFSMADSIKYYAEMPWCPDFGEYSGLITLITYDGSRGNTKGYSYGYDKNQVDDVTITGYCALLESLGFVYYDNTTTDSIVYVKDSYFVSISVKEDLLIVITFE